MKVKVISDRKIIEKELDLEYPYHLYFQDEDCLNDYSAANLNQRMSFWALL